MDWLILIIAGLFEAGFAFCLGKAKQSTGTEVYIWYGAFLMALIISMVLLVKATQTLPIGTAYAVWTGIGALGAAVLGIVIFGEPASLARVGCIALIVLGILGLKLTSGHS